MPPIRFLLAAALTLSPGIADAQSKEVRRLSITEQRVMRIPLRSTPVPTPRPVDEDRETRGPQCVARSKIAGASLKSPNSVDFVLQSTTRLRAHLKDKCPAIDYYAGFYLNPTSDGMICADRDALHARSGGECQIDSFRKLTPKGTTGKARR